MTSIAIEDPIELAVFSNLVAAVAEEACSTLERTAYSTFIKESKDFSVAIAALDGTFLAYPKLSGVPTFLGLPLDDTLKTVKEWSPGDVLITNDPYTTGGLVTHAPDINLIAPIFFEGRLVAFCWGFIHSSDVGGAVPGSIAPSNREIFQEGLRIPPTMLYSKGVLNHSLVDILKTNVRIPHQVWGDTEAILAAFHVATARVIEIFGRYGGDRALALVEQCMSYAEAKARAVISKIPSGTYRFADYLDDDVISSNPIRIALAMTVSGSEVHLDFTGTDPQVFAAFNLSTAGKKSHGWLTLGIQHYLLTEDQQMPVNAGILRPLSVTAPAGTVVHAVSPASVGGRLAAGIRVLDITLGALAQAVPEHVPAAGSGQGMLPVISMPSLEKGTHKINVLQPLVGGSGGRANGSGYDGTDYSLSFLKNTPIEIIESEMDVLVHRYYYVPDSGGPGENRGGLGVGFTAEALVPDTSISMRGMERTRFAPWGIRGGENGSLTQPGIVNRGTPHERRVPKVDVLWVDRGDVFELITSGGGGYGDPLKRRLDDLQHDLDCGYVTVAQAQTRYGVAFAGASFRIDKAATATRRAELTNQRSADLPTFSFCAARESHESVWGDEAYATLQDIYATLPLHSRTYAKRMIMDQVRKDMDGKQRHRLSSDDVWQAWNTSRSKLGAAQTAS